MRFIEGTPRNQSMLLAASLDEYVDTDNEVRSIDLFVNCLDLEQMGFALKKMDNGRPAYHPAVLLKLYLYGYLNGIRSSRALERECKRNVEVMWLLQELKPDHNTINSFRKENGTAIKQVFRSTVSIARHFNLIGGKLIAGDSTKLRAQNSKKNNFNQKKVARHLAYIDEKLEQYRSELAAADGDDEKEHLKGQIAQQKKRRKRYKEIGAALQASGEDQMSVSDPDSRQMIIRNNITEVAYNVQSVNDAKHCLPIDYEVTQHNDSKALGPMMERTSRILGHTKFTALLDKGYHTGSELKAAQQMGITTIVAIPDIPSASMAPDPAYNVSNFTYHPRKHCYTCPEGHTLTTNGNWYSKTSRNRSVQVQHFKTKACKTCPMINSCTKNTGGRGRVIERTEHQDAIDRNRRNVERKEHLYKRRQAIIEHTYGTIKRGWNFHYILTKKYLHRASADVGLIFTAYNLKRMINMLGPDTLREYLTSLSGHFYLIWRPLIATHRQHKPFPFFSSK